MSEPRATNDLLPLDSLAYALGKPQGSAIIKQEFSDFRVDEELAFAPSGEGDHVFIQIQKTDASTIEVAKRLSDVAAVRQADVSYSGMKDRRGETSQWFSVKLPPEKEPRLAALEDEKLAIIALHRNSRKLKIGSHARNRFQLKLRGCEGSRDEFERRLEALRDKGVPNYFGAQRFGAQMSNLRQVSVLMRQVLEGDKAVQQGGRFRRGMLYSAARSYLFNQVLSERISAGNWQSYLRGDVLSLDGSGRCFKLADEEAGEEWTDELQQRIETLDIHTTGPLPGIISAKDKYVSSGEAADIEKRVVTELDWMVAGLEAFGLQASRRALRFAAAELSWQWEQDIPALISSSDAEACGNLNLAFTLPRGAYATSLLRELCQLRES